MSRHRRCMALRGPRGWTREAALRLLDALEDRAVLWVGADETRFVTATAAQARKLLGAAFDVVVLDLHDGLDGDVLGQCHGFVWGGGCLLLRMPPEGVRPLGGQDRLAVHPFGPEDVGMRFWDRFVARLERSEALLAPSPLQPAARVARGTAEQARVVSALADGFVRGDRPAMFALLADRGRGKSSALGLALSDALSRAPLRVAVSASDERSAAEVFRFAGDPSGQADASTPRGGPLRFVPPLELVGAPDPGRGPPPWDVVVIDEAARLPVPLLQRVVGAHPRARIAFATTARGYEGTGRGFVLRFLQWAQEQPRPLQRSSLTEPIRWAPDDPLERLVFDVLRLDATIAPEVELTGSDAASARHRQPTPRIDEVQHVVLRPDELAHDERLLDDFFGLLVHAHYRTTASDLHRVLDAPNLALHASLLRGRVVAASVVAIEGGLPSGLREAMYWGRTRVRGHALADTLVSHCGELEAGALSMIRSVRIATHPAVRRLGLARGLVEHVHATHRPDLFGTLFGATPELVAFRRSVGYELVRVGVSRGSRTGEPAAVMIHPVSEAARELTRRLRADLARDLPLQLELLDSEGELSLDPRLPPALREELPEPTPMSVAALDAAVEHYLHGPRPFESAAYAVSAWVRRCQSSAAWREALDERQRTLVRGRVLQRRAWSVVCREAGFDTVPAAMRALRRALRRLQGPRRVAPPDRGGYDPS